MKWSLSQHDYIQLFTEVHNAINLAIADPSLSEPQLVANLVWHLPRHLNRVTISGGYSIRSGGIFVHAQPLVKCGSFPEPTPHSVEIGDLLLLRTAIYHGTVIDRRAMLLQAKKICSTPARPDNINQHYLYARWPTFEYVRSTPALNGKRRHLQGTDLYNAAKYLLIEKGGSVHCCLSLVPSLCAPHGCLLAAQPTMPTLSHYSCFLNELVRFIVGDGGKEYVTPPPLRTRNWDRVIEDLISITATRISSFMRKTTSGLSSNRGHMLAMSFLSGRISDYSTLSQVGVSSEHINRGGETPPNVPEHWDYGNEEDGGISIIEFVIDSESVT